MTSTETPTGTDAPPPLPAGSWVGALVEGAGVELIAFDAEGRAGATASARMTGADLAAPGNALARMAATLDPRARLVLTAGWPPLPSDTGQPAQDADLAAVPAQPVPCPPLGNPPRIVPLKVDADAPSLTVLALPPIGQHSPLDLMGAASIRIAGLLAQRPEFDGVVCLPGGRNYWAHISAGEVVSFQGFLAQDLMDALSPATGHNDDPADSAFQTAFDTALADIQSRPERLAGTLHRALLDPATARATLRGALIGAELSAARPYWLGQQVVVLTDGPDAEVYARALDAQGAGAELVSGRRMAMRGLAAARARL